MPQFTDSQKAAIGFMNQQMGTNPSASQIVGMGPEIDEYAHQNSVNPQELRNALHSMLPQTGDHPEYEYDAASGAVSDGSHKVYGEGFMPQHSEDLLRCLVREQLMAEHIDGQPFAGSLEDLAQLHGRAWGHGSVVDTKDWEESIKLGRQFTRGTASSPLRTARGTLGEEHLRKVIRKITGFTG